MMRISYISAALLFIGTGCSMGANPPPNAQLERELVGLNIKIRMLEKQLSTCGEEQTSDPIHRLCVQIFTGSEATVTRVGMTTHITLPTHMLFVGELRVRDEAKPTLDLLANLINDAEGRDIVIVGHSAAIGSHASGMGDILAWQNSFASAAAVLQVLTDEFGLDASRATIATQGDRNPIASIDTPDGHAQNDRVVIIVKPIQAAP